MKKNIATVSTSGDLKLLIIGPFVLEWIIENNKIKLKQQNIYIKLNLISFSFGMWNWLIKIAIGIQFTRYKYWTLYFGLLNIDKINCQKEFVPKRNSKFDRPKLSL